MEWKEYNNALTRTWKFTSFKEAVSFIERVASLSEKHNHHPRIENEYTTVTLTLTTHDEDGLTEKDYALAKDIDTL